MLATTSTRGGLHVANMTKTGARANKIDPYYVGLRNQASLLDCILERFIRAETTPGRIAQGRTVLAGTNLSTRGGLIVAHVTIASASAKIR